MFPKQSNGTGQSGRILFIVLGVVGVLAVAAVAGLYFYGNHKAKQEVDRIVTEMNQGGGGVTYGSVSYSPISQDVVIEDVAIAAPTGSGYTLERVIVSDFDLDHDVPEYMRIKLENFSFAVDRDTMSMQAEPLLAMGITQFTGDMVVDYTVDRANSMIHINELSMLLDDLGNTHVSVSLGNITPESMAMALFDPSSITIISGQITYEDHSLMERSLAMGAQQEGMDPEALRAETLNAMDQAIVQAREEGSEAGVQLITAMKTFLENPGTIRLTVAPPAPVSVGQLMAAEGEFAIFDLLHVTSEAF